jgi:hypothetical protein
MSTLGIVLIVITIALLAFFLLFRYGKLIQGFREHLKENR